jgi:NAD(P)-dependent dehydrogenase (short-subunit alcohol dehydrogenase family)
MQKLANFGKVALVSGSTNGIGKVIAARFVSEGYTVIQNSRNKLNNYDLLGAKHIEGDVTNYKICLEIIESIKAEYGRLDVLVCNVGSGADLDTTILPGDRWSHFLSSNLLSCTFFVDSALQLLIKSKGNVVAISSICGSSFIKGAPVEYSVAKAALNMYIKSMAFKYANNGIRFNVVSPGNVLFEGSTWHNKIKNNEELVTKFISENVPMGVFIEPEAIADAVLFLASDSSNFTTGVELSIDGGQSL